MDLVDWFLGCCVFIEIFVKECFEYVVEVVEVIEFIVVCSGVF